MKRLLVAAVVGLAFAPAAQAKGPLQICGASRCTLLGTEMQPPVRIVGVDPSTTPLVAPPAPAPYYVIRFTPFSDPLAYWIPSASLLRLVGSSTSVTGQWVATLPVEEGLLRDKAAGIEAYPAPTRTTAYVDYEPVKRATGYLRLWTIGTPVAAAPPTRWLEVWLFGGRSPWNDRNTLFWISRKGSFLKRDDGVVLRIPASIADRIRKRQPLG
jgi:hypothetical protein